MKRPIAILAILLIAIGTALAADVRLDSLINFDWRFHLGEMDGAERTEVDDHGWQAVDLPHDYQFYLPWDSTAIGGRGFKQLETGWYRKTFRADEAWRGRRVIIDFEGIMLNGTVYFNGKKVGEDYYGYQGIEVDVTKLIRWNQDNVIAVHCTTGHRRASRWYTGGGINRDVRLVVKDPVAVARNGLYITTPKITADMAEVQVQVEIDGPRELRSGVVIEATIKDPRGDVVARTQGTVTGLSKLKCQEVPLPVATVKEPQLWSCDTPSLYTCDVVLKREGRVIDNVSDEFGIRTIEYSPEFGFKLNGKKIFWKGIANHHDLGAVGAEAFEAAIIRQYKQLKAFGYNCVRATTNPYSKSFIREADRQGFLIIDELYDKWTEYNYWSGSIPFSQMWPWSVTEWIKRDRNHPSVVLWSLGNELQFREDLCGYETGDWGITTYKMMKVLVERYDKTRPTTVCMFPARANAIDKHDNIYNTYRVAPELATVTDIASFNYCYDAYEDYLKHDPQLNIFQSEASTHELAKAFFAMDEKKMVGLTYWGAIEYWGESNGWPKKGWNYSFFNHTLEPYPQAYLIKSAFEPDKPQVRIAVVDEESEELDWNDVVSGRMKMTSHWNRPSGSRQNLFTFTNADEVELLLNGRSLGRQRNNTADPGQRNMIYWKNIPYEPGRLVAVARKGGREVARHQIETTGKAVALKAVVENSEWRGDGMDLQYIRVYAVDSKGREVATADNKVTFSVSGVATLKATDNGDHYTNDLPLVNPKPMLEGFVMAILRAGRQPGDVTVRITADNLKGKTIKLHTR